MKRKIYLVVLFNALAFAFLVAAVSADPKSSGGPVSTPPIPSAPSATPLAPRAPEAPAGSGFTYQGRLKDGNSPANGSYDLQFTLYDAASGGNVAGGPITLLNQTVTDGLFTVQLDFGSSAIQGSARWLKIAVRQSGGGSYTTLSPLQALTTAPYAMSLMPGAVITGSLAASPVISLTNVGTGGTGVYGNATGFGLYGTTANAGGYGVYGSNTAANGVGIDGTDTASAGVGVAGNGGIFGVYGSGVDGVYGTTSNAGGNGVDGRNTSSGGAGVYGDGNMGVYGQSNASDGTGVKGEADNGVTAYGVYGSSTTGFGVYGLGNSFGVYGRSSNYGVYGSSTGGSGYGVYGTGSNYGVYGYGGTYGTYGYGTTYGVYGQSGDSGSGLYGSGLDGVVGSGSAYGVYGAGPTGVYGWSGSSGGLGLYGYASNGFGAYGQSSSIGGAGVYGYNSSNIGVYGVGAYGVYGSGSPYAGYFSGDVHVTGLCCSAEQGTYQIDDPQDPANKYLNQSAVQSSEMKDIYDGVATLDASGEATVTMPEWFQALNRNFRYQLTAIGVPAPNLYVAKEIQGNQFKIAGGKEGMKVSWQVTGVRQDPYANDHPLQVEQPKPSGEKGSYLYPKGYGQPDSKGLDYQRQQTSKKQAPPSTPQPRQPQQPDLPYGK